MSNGLRHTLGIFAGLILTPALAAALMYGMHKILEGREEFNRTLDSGYGTDGLIALALFAGAGLLIALMLSSRLSPLAALIGGLAFGSMGVLWVVKPRWMLDKTGDKLPDDLDLGYTTLGPTGFLALIGAALLFSILFPSRWRAVKAREPGYEYGGPGLVPGAPQPGEPPSPFEPTTPASSNPPLGQTMVDPLESRHAHDQFGPSHESPSPSVIGGEGESSGRTQEFVQPPGGSYEVTGYEPSRTRSDVPVYEPTRRDDDPYRRS